MKKSQNTLDKFRNIKLNKTQKIRLLSCLLIISVLANIGMIVTGNSSGDNKNNNEEIKLQEGTTRNPENETEISIEYQNLYPELYAEDTSFNFKVPEYRTVYLTFDDGPSKITNQILDVLKEKGVKATFFVMYTESEEGKATYKRIVEEGHAIGVHTSSHDYNGIYQSVEAFLADFEKTHSQIKAVTGYDTRLFRFPGGSINAYNMSNYQQIIAEMTRRGYIFYDWTVDSRDTSKNPNKDIVLSSVVNGIAGKHESVVLMHDAAAKTYTLEALPEMIQIIKDSSYYIQPLSPSVKPPHFNYKE